MKSPDGEWTEKYEIPRAHAYDVTSMLYLDGSIKVCARSAHTVSLLLGLWTLSVKFIYRANHTGGIDSIVFQIYRKRNVEVVISMSS
jgi:hypothetical protein